MPVSDADVGITEFLTARPPFVGIVKQQLSDFIVNEVTRDGAVVRLTSTTAPPDPLPPPASSPSHTPSVDLDTACADLDAALSSAVPIAPAKSIATLIRDFAAAPPSPGNPAALVLPPLPEKALRTLVHAWVKLHAPLCVTDTIELTADVRAIRVRHRGACRPWKRRRVNADALPASSAPSRNLDAVADDTYDPRERRDTRAYGRHDMHRRRPAPFRGFVEFVLWKEGRDTAGALADVARLLRVPVDALSHAGTKDKRAITTQRVRVRGVPPSRLAALNRALTHAGGGRARVLLGNFVELRGGRSVRPLGLGDLAGNRFTVVLRGVCCENDGDVMRAVEEVQKGGFINYFGLQRFGSGAARTHETGYAVLRGDFEEACRLVLLPAVIAEVEEGKSELRDERRVSNAALEEYAAGRVSERDVLRDLPRWMMLERSVVAGFLKQGQGKKDAKAAFACIPRNMRKMYGHAVQSYLWNVTASARIRQSREHHAIAGDLVPLTATRDTTLSHRTEVRKVTAEEAASKAVRMDRVLLPVPGANVAVLDTEAGSAARDIIAREKIDMSKLEGDYEMPGTYRWLIARPMDVEAKLVHYSAPGERLVLADFPDDVSQHLPGFRGIVSATIRREENAADSARLGKQAEDESRITRDRSEELEKQMAAEQIAVNAVRLDAKGKVQGAESCDVGNASNDQAKELERSATDSGRAGAGAMRMPYIGLVVSFTLGCAEYATMFLRELTKQDSSVEHQKAQQAKTMQHDEE